MQDRAATKSGAGAPPVWAIAIAVVVLVAFVAWLGFRNLAPPSNHVAVKSGNDWLGVLAQQSGGDFNKLSAQDQQMLNVRTQGKGAEYLKLKYEAMK